MTKITKIIQLLLGVIIGIISLLIYQYSLPVIVFAQASNWSIEESKVSAEIEGYKIRSCKPVKGAAIGYIVKNKVVYEVPITLKSSIENKPKSFIYKIDFGKWDWNFNQEESKASSVLIALKYECAGRMTDEQIGPFEIPVSVSSSPITNIK
jgi:hypothetical protein